MRYEQCCSTPFSLFKVDEVTGERHMAGFHEKGKSGAGSMKPVAAGFMSVISEFRKCQHVI